jgi:hypothetical protein
MLDSPDLGNIESGQSSKQKGSCGSFAISTGICRTAERVHEDQFREPDHVHALIDVPTGLSIEKVVQLKGKFFSLGEF